MEEIKIVRRFSGQNPPSGCTMTIGFIISRYAVNLQRLHRYRGTITLWQKIEEKCHKILKCYKDRGALLHHPTGYAKTV
jgi:hypothetical protein